MSYYIIVRGPLGVGKTTISKRLAQNLNGEYISVDAVLSEQGLDQVDAGAECIPLENFVKGNELILPGVRQALAAGRVVVFDGNFYHQGQVEHLLTHLSEPHYVFTLKAPVEVCIERDSHREMSYGEDSARAVHWLVSRLEYGIAIDTAGKTEAQVVEELESYLP
jgi:shikimate kinase